MSNIAIKGKRFDPLPTKVYNNAQNIEILFDMVGEGGIDDVMIGTATVYTEEEPLVGLRVIDGYHTSEGEKCLVAGMGPLNGLYIINPNEWLKLRDVTKNQVVSIDEGEVFGGSQLKKTASGITVVVKNPERIKWSVI